MYIDIYHTNYCYSGGTNVQEGGYDGCLLGVDDIAVVAVDDNGG